MVKRLRSLRRSNANRRIAGVLGGLGEHFGVKPVWLRVIFVMFLFQPWSYLGLSAPILGWFSVLGVLVYLALIAIPPANKDLWDSAAPTSISLSDGLRRQLSSRAVGGFGLVSIATALATYACGSSTGSPLSVRVGSPGGPSVGRGDGDTRRRDREP